MAKTETLDWGAWREGKVQVKASAKPFELVERVKRVRMTSAQVRKLVTTGMVIVAGITFAIHGFDGTAFAYPINGAGDAASVVAQPEFAGSFQDQLHAATKPIRDIIFGFGHEIYFVMMAWGGIEALIGKSQQGFARMKGATAAYIILYWVPWIVQTVNSAVPHF